MGKSQRVKLYEEIEAHRGRPLIAYVTSGRQGAAGNIASDGIREFADQLFKLPEGTKKLDILVNSYGGDGLASWRLVLMIREFLGAEGHLTCLVPYYAFSAGTLIAVGANEVFMHPTASLGPVDPQITLQNKDGATQFAYEDLAAYANFLKEEGGLTEQAEKSGLLQPLVNEIKPSVIGMSKRSSAQSIVMAEKLLKLHMTGADTQKAEIIAEKLSKSYFSHGHALSRREADSLGLRVAKSDPKLEKLIWAVYEDFEEEMHMREMFDPRMEYLRAPGAAVLLAPPPFVNVPANMPPAIAQQVWQQVLNNLGTTQGPVLDVELVQAAIESRRISSRFVTKAKLFGARQADLNFLIGMPALSAKWER